MKVKIMKTTLNGLRTQRRDKYASDDERWNAVVRRNANADGKFYYSVKTTGVYCRPSCAARVPKRDNVPFHASADAAERGGFRPCKRCRPTGPSLAEQYAAKVALACRTIEQAEDMPTLETLAKQAAMSPFHFHRVFSKVAGLTPKAYAVAHRAERVRQELPKRNTVTEAIYHAGFNSNSRFYADSSRMLGMTPKNFRNGGNGESIRYTIGACSLGSILVAASEKGVCAIFLGDDPSKLREELRRSFRKARLIAGDAKFDRVIGKVIDFIEAPKLSLNLPLDLRGTAFQRRVWTALREIPAGSTTSYSEVARRIGLPKAVRAVAGAIASNNIAVAIPCHRVLRAGGALSGYRWGVERKRALLNKESR